MKRILLVFFILVATKNFIFAAGTTSAEFLKLGVGARAVSMGEAYTAAGDEPSALYWNPASLRRLRNPSLTFMHASYIESSFFDYLAFAMPMGNHAFGVGVQYLSAGSITRTDEAGLDVGSFTPNNLAFTLGYAKTVEDFPLHFLNGFAIGIAPKFIQSKILDSANAYAVDLGLLSPFYLNDKLNFAITISNLGSKMKFEKDSHSLPLIFKLGSAYNLEFLAISLDVGFPKSSDPYAALGAEYRRPLGEVYTYAIRAGFNSRTINDIEGLAGVSVGFGLSYQKLALDYAFLPFGDLGLTHRVSLSFNF